ncbi:hypothetical protein ACIQGO_19910 [Streptomyces shenzhenensis]
MRRRGDARRLDPPARWLPHTAHALEPSVMLLTMLPAPEPSGPPAAA